jgi:hypothetical protein
MKEDYSSLEMNVWCHMLVYVVNSLSLYVLLLNGEGGSDKGQVAIDIVHPKLQFPSKVSLAYVTFVTTVLILPLREQLRMALVRYRSISGPLFIWIVILVLGYSICPPVFSSYFWDTLHKLKS